jgi:hypothetical protein
MSTLYIKIHFFLHYLIKQLKSCFLRLGCHFISSWYFIKSDCICTTGQVVKLNRIYTYEENEQIDIVRLTDIHIERGYVYCSLFFFSKNKIITVRHSLFKGVYIIWRLMDNEDFDEIMSRRLWEGVSNQNDLLEFVFKL